MFDDRIAEIERDPEACPVMLAAMRRRAGLPIGGFGIASLGEGSQDTLGDGFGDGFGDGYGDGDGYGFGDGYGDGDGYGYG